MFDFEKLQVYSKAKAYKIKSDDLIYKSNLDKSTKGQLRSASLSIMLNIAEGSGRYTKADKKNFYIISRGSAFECVAILDYLKDCKQISEEQFNLFYSELDEISRMLYGMVNHLNIK